jgi:hypothetical protein
VSRYRRPPVISCRRRRISGLTTGDFRQPIAPAPVEIRPRAMNASSDEPSFLTIFHQHFERYPLMQLDDVYKLAHQANFGPGHLVRNPPAKAALTRIFGR